MKDERAISNCTLFHDYRDKKPKPKPKHFRVSSFGGKSYLRKLWISVSVLDWGKSQQYNIFYNIINIINTSFER